MLNMLQVIIRVWAMNFFATQSFQRLALLIKRVTNFTGEDCLSVSSPGFWRASEFRSLCKICRSFEKGLRVRLSCKNHSSYTQAMQETKIIHPITKQYHETKIVFLTYIYFLLLFNNNCVIVFHVWNIEIKTGELVHP